MKKRGQVAVEYLGTMAFLLVVITILSAFAYTTYFDTIKHRMLDDSLNSLSETVNQAYSLGKGTVLFVRINLPDGVTDSNASGRHVGFTFVASAGSSEYWNAVDANVFGALPTSAGPHIIKVEYADQNVVLSEYLGD